MRVCVYLDAALGSFHIDVQKGQLRDWLGSYTSFSNIQEYWYSLKYDIIPLTVLNLASRVMSVSLLAVLGCSTLIKDGSWPEKHWSAVFSWQYFMSLYVEHLIFLAEPETTSSLLLIQSLEICVLSYFPSQCPSNRPYSMTFTDTMEDWWSTFVSEAFIFKTISYEFGN